MAVGSQLCEDEFIRSRRWLHSWITGPSDLPWRNVITAETKHATHSLTFTASLSPTAASVPGRRLRDLHQVWVLQAAALRCEQETPGTACRGGWWRQISLSGCCLYCCWPCDARGFDPCKTRTWTHTEHKGWYNSKYRPVNIRSEMMEVMFSSALANIYKKLLNQFPWNFVEWWDTRKNRLKFGANLDSLHNRAFFNIFFYFSENN